jgi:hypothetical protein
VIQSLLLHCNSAILAAPNDRFVAKYMILMESRNPRDGLDHILDGVAIQDAAGAQRCIKGENCFAIAAPRPSTPAPGV